MCHVRVPLPMIIKLSYSLMPQTRHLLSEKDEWSVKDGDFDLEDFFLRIVAVFESAPDSDWVKSTLEWWNL